MLYTSTRVFRIWDYNVSHKQLLLRSPKSPEHATNIDIAFWGVEYVDLPSTLPGVAIASHCSDDLARVERATGMTCDPTLVYRFDSAGHSFIVVAVGFHVLENDLDIFESSLEYFAGSDGGRDRGLVLAHS